MKLVVDASFAMLWLAGDRASPAVEELDRRFHAGQIELHAPELFMLEVANVVWKSVRRGLRTLDDAIGLYRDLEDLPIELHRHRDLVGAALDLATRRNFSVYDGAYVALALRETLPLFTADRRLAAAVEDAVEVVAA